MSSTTRPPDLTVLIDFDPAEAVVCDTCRNAFDVRRTHLCAEGRDHDPAEPVV